MYGFVAVLLCRYHSNIPKEDGIHLYEEFVKLVQVSTLEMFSNFIPGIFISDTFDAFQDGGLFWANIYFIYLSTKIGMCSLNF